MVLSEVEGDEGGVVSVVVGSCYGVDRGGELDIGWGCRCGSV